MRKLRLAVAPSLALAIASGACAPQGGAAPPAEAVTVDTAAVVAGVADLWAKWAVADTAEDLDAFMALMTDDVRLDAKGFPAMIGKESMRATMAPLYSQVDYLEASVAAEATTAVSNELAYQRGTYRERYTMKGQPGEMTDHGRYAAAFAKGPDGQWRWAYMMAFVDSTTTRK